MLHCGSEPDRSGAAPEAGSRVVKPLEVSRPVLPAGRAVRARTREERVAFEGVGLAREDVYGIRLTDVAGGGGRGAGPQRRHVALLLLGDGGGARARRGEVVLEQGARRHRVRVEAEAARALLQPRARHRHGGRRHVLRLEREPSNVEVTTFRLTDKKDLKLIKLIYQNNLLHK